MASTNEKPLDQHTLAYQSALAVNLQIEFFRSRINTVILILPVALKSSALGFKVTSFSLTVSGLRSSEFSRTAVTRPRWAPISTDYTDNLCNLWMNGLTNTQRYFSEVVFFERSLCRSGFFEWESAMDVYFEWACNDQLI